MMSYVAEHSADMLVVLTNVALGHVTWRALPDEHKHNVRKVVRKVRKGQTK